MPKIKFYTWIGWVNKVKQEISCCNKLKLIRPECVTVKNRQKNLERKWSFSETCHILYGNMTWLLGLVYNIFINFSLDVLNKCYDNRVYLQLATCNFFKIPLSQLNRNWIIINRNWIYEFPHKLPNEVRHRTLGN